MAEQHNSSAGALVKVMRDDNIKKMIHERLGKRAGQFTTSLISVVNSSKAIAECEPMTVIQAALTAASMDLPIQQNLGFAYIVPYNNSYKKTKEAQFQMGWKGFVQLAQRSGTFKTINATEVRESELTGRDRMTGELKFAWKDDDVRGDSPVIGYLAYFKLLNGFEKSLYMTKEEIEAHANRYSQAYRGSQGGSNRTSFKTPWETDFDLMAQKTVLKQLLSRFAPLSTEMQEAIAADQGVNDGNGHAYPDNSEDYGNADDGKKAAIIAANATEAETTEPTESEDEDVTSPPPKDSGDPTGTAGEGAETPPKKSVKEMAAERGWTKDKASAKSSRS